jgi:hypothetical protein
MTNTQSRKPLLVGALTLVSLSLWAIVQVSLPTGFHIVRATRSSSQDTHWLEAAISTRPTSVAILRLFPRPCETSIVEWSSGLIPDIDRNVPSAALLTSMLLDLPRTDASLAETHPFALSLLEELVSQCGEGSQGMTELALAVHEGHVELVNTLLRAGADPDYELVNSSGKTSSPKQLALRLHSRAKAENDETGQARFSLILGAIGALNEAERARYE